MNLKIFSIGGYSSWAYYRPARLLFDCGEGCAMNLRNEVFGVEKIFISHSHGDHVNGLAGFISARASARGDKEKPLTIYLHGNNKYIDRLVSYLGDVSRNLSYSLEFSPIDVGDKIKIDDRRHVEVFRLDHSRAFTTLGFRVMERRTRLKAGIDPTRVKELVLKGEAVNESYDGNLFTYTLDSAAFDLSKVANAAEWVADCNFLDGKDRDDPTHMTLEEVTSIAKTQNVKVTYLAHISSRYKKVDFDKIVAPGCVPIVHHRVNEL